MESTVDLNRVDDSQAPLSTTAIVQRSPESEHNFSSALIELICPISPDDISGQCHCVTSLPMSLVNVIFESG